MKNITQVEKDKIYFGLLLLIVIILWITSWHLVGSNFQSWNERGSFGDMFGAVNALFSSLAFAGLLYTIYLQSRQLKEQSIEQRKQEIQLKQQNERITRQNFENLFFNMLKNIQIISSNMVTQNGDKSGRVYLHELFDFFENLVKEDHTFRTTLPQVNSKNKDIIKNIIIKKYNELYSGNSYNLGHFYRSAHNLLKSIENEFPDHETRCKYASIFQAQLSNDELGFIFYNCLSDFSLNKDGLPEFRRMVDNLKILENIDQRCVFAPILTEYFPHTNFFFKKMMD